MTTPQRIIDANANRAREALRVLEEAARFVAEDQSIALELKQMRHDLASALPDMLELITHRNTPGDVGTTLATDAEQSRSGLTDVIAAAGGRLAEALRALEEYSKLTELGPGFAGLARVAERVRYRSYDITQRLILALGPPRRQWRLCLLLTQSLCRLPWRKVVDQAVTNGADCIQVREKDMDAGPLLDHTREVIGLADGRTGVIVNDRPDVAVLAAADGVHLGQNDLSPADAREIVGPRMLVGVSTSNLDQARRAEADGADYCGVGPMFETTTKHKPDLAGPGYLRDYLAWNGLAHLAIGGITPENIAELAEAGCQGVAVSSAVCASEEPGEVTARLSSVIRAAETREEVHP